MFRGVRRFIVATAFALFLTGCGPVSALFHDPGALPALEQDGRIHYDAGARAYAEAVAKILPDAIAKVEAAQRRPFGKPFIIVAYADDAAYAAANGRSSTKPSGVTFFDRVALSPRLWREESERLENVLVHELSHEHLFSRLGALNYYRVPAWFLEGLAVMASDGGGAEGATAQEARRAIREGRAIETPDDPYLLSNISLKPPPPRSADEDVRLRVHLAYRQAGLFVEYLRASNETAFKSLLDRLYAGERFKAAFEASYKSSVAENWSRFAEKASKN